MLGRGGQKKDEELCRERKYDESKPNTIERLLLDEEDMWELDEAKAAKRRWGGQRGKSRCTIWHN
jgi:hypothetical protein